MAILITGAEGMVGSNLKSYYEQNGQNVVPFKGDTTRTEDWDQYKHETFDAVIHLAAYPGVRPSFEQPNRYYYNNTVSMENFLAYGLQMSSKLLYASSSNAKEWWLNPYAATKKMNECQARPHRVVGMRFHTVFPGRPDMLFRKLQRKEVSYINKNHYRDFIHVKDLCAAIDTIVHNFDLVYNGTLRPGTHTPGVVDIGTGHSTPVVEVAKLMGYDGDYIETEARGERVQTRADVEYLLQLGWTPKRNILDVDCHTE